MPLFSVVDRDLDNTFDPTSTKLLESLQSNQSVTIGSLLDKLPDHKFSTNDFIDDMITSKYYTPHEIKQARLDLSTFHMNIGSLQLHINEIQTLLKKVNFPFDILGISETRLRHGEQPQTDIEIPGYENSIIPHPKLSVGVWACTLNLGNLKK